MEWLKIILENLLPILVAVLTPILVVLGRWFIRYLEKKLDFDMSLEVEEKLLEYIHQGVSYAEEKARAALRVDPGNMTSGQEKLDAAMRYVRDQIERQGWDDMAGELLSDMIEAALNQSRSAGIIPPSKPPA